MAKVLISIPDKLLKAVDKRAKREYETRSSYIRELVVRKINAVELSAGVWSRSFPSGKTFVRKSRKGWSNRTKNY